jgi:hypothetical protein
MRMCDKKLLTLGALLGGIGIVGVFALLYLLLVLSGFHSRLDLWGFGPMASSSSERSRRFAKCWRRSNLTRRDGGADRLYDGRFLPLNGPYEEFQHGP